MVALAFAAGFSGDRHEQALGCCTRFRGIDGCRRRVGVDGNELHYAGDSAVLDALGQPLAELGAAPQVVDVVLPAAGLRSHRERFPAQLDADPFELR